VEREGSQTAFAKRHGIERTHINAILSGRRPITESAVDALGPTPPSEPPHWVKVKMTNLLKQAIHCDDSDRAARIIMDALGIETDELANLCLKHWPSEHKKRARVIGHWLHAEAQFLA